MMTVQLLMARDVKLIAQEMNLDGYVPSQELMENLIVLLHVLMMLLPLTGQSILLSNVMMEM